MHGDPSAVTLVYVIGNLYYSLVKYNCYKVTFIKIKVFVIIASCYSMRLYIRKTQICIKQFYIYIEYKILLNFIKVECNRYKYLLY